MRTCFIWRADSYSQYPLIKGNDRPFSLLQRSGRQFLLLADGPKRNTIYIGKLGITIYIGKLGKKGLKLQVHVLT